MKTPAMQSEIRTPKSLKQKVLAFTFLTLFCSTGGSSAAVITWLDSFQGGQSWSLIDVDFDGGVIVTQADATALGSYTLLDESASATFTNTFSGFSIGGTGEAIFVEAFRLLEISGLADGESVLGVFNFSLLPGFDMLGGINKWNPNIQGGSWEITPWEGTPFFTQVPTAVDLTNGTYAVTLYADSGSGEPLSLGNGETFASFNVVPEPGSAMLCLVAMGLGLRRKRSGVSVRANSHGDSVPMML